MPTASMVARATDWLGRFAVATRNCGLGAAFQIFVRSRRSTKPRRVRLMKLAVDFWFRGRADYGVMSHFYIPSYRILDPEDRVRWVIDAGSNIGDETVKFAHFHPSAQIIAIEADDANAQILSKNVGGNPRVHVENKALWSVADEALELVKSGSPESSTTRPAVDGSVGTVSIASLRAVYGFDRIDILKLDIEGAEHELLRDGQTDWLSMVDVVIMEVADHEIPNGLQRLLAAFSGPVDCMIVNENVIAVRRGCGLSASRYLYL